MTHQYITKFDLPADCQHDHVTIEMAATDDFPFVATPYIEDATGYTEAEDWEVTEKYTEAVRHGTEIPLELIGLEQPPAEVGGNF